MPGKRALPSEEGDRADRKRARTKLTTGLDNKKTNQAINMALSKAKVGKKYAWMNQETRAVENPPPSFYKAVEKVGEKEAEGTPAKNITGSKKPALPTPPKADKGKKPEQQKKQKPVVQEPEEDPALAEAQEQEDLLAMVDYVYQFAY
ncbi:hypothetical protein F5Y00DRAFT_260767 [Daldinia vernicosa]|uniref:uncharacterized protein n=1 Tax=Daldinia vernicosa TaxID=114800 RepID=UPI0020085CD1|nr:uncharacterized protein F5Y00DRAFT_260767 [Daldinia vernicosa]KAI0850035.1 hypothetical protein F5Y00DRAFT_260767 [Daldinia vernicosa]